MIARLVRPLLISLVCFLFFVTANSARADIGYAPDSKAVPIIIAVVAVGALIVFLVVHHHGHSLKGCVSTSTSGMQMLNDENQKIYLLSGDLDGIHAGERVRVKGKKKKVAGSEQQFAVTKLLRDFGTCHAPN